MSSIEQIDAELARLRADISSVERAPPSFEEVWPAVEAELGEAEATFRRLGPQLSHRSVPVLPEFAFQQHQILIGATLVANRKAIDSERARVRAATEGGISAVDKERKLSELRAAVLQAAGRLEIELRPIERDGEFQSRVVHPELVIYRQAAVGRLANPR